MNKEERKLLLKDLCARLPYGVKVYGNYPYSDGENIVDDKRVEVLDISKLDWFLNGIEIKPYLRPLQSMTEDEMGDYGKVKFTSDGIYKFTDYKKTGKGFVNIHTVNWNTGEKSYTFQVNSRTMLHEGAMGIDWLNANYFDYRGLIGMGLALKAPDEMYKSKEGGDK